VAGRDRDATVAIAPVDVPSDDGPSLVTEVLPAHDTQELEPTREIAAGGGTAAAVEAPRHPRERPLTPVWFGRALLIVAVLAVVAVVATRANPDGPSGGGGDGGGVAPVAIQGASDFDPLGGGGEHGDEVSLAFDGDPATAWTTEGYEQPNLGGIKAGVGIWFDLGQEVDVRRIDLTLPVAGSDIAVYALAQQPQGGDPSAWGEPIATLAQAATTQDIEVAADRTARYWLVWLTNLGPDGNRYRGGVAEIAFAAR
jgi:putative peptidoglycan lipid II flippase